MTKELLFSVTKKDLDFEFFRAGGNGGQKQNKTSSGVRIRHRASGAVSESRSSAHQHENKKLAFRRLLETPKFKAWMKVTTAEALTTVDDKVRRERAIKEAVEQTTRPQHIETQILDENDEWITVEEGELT